jgi:DNA repair protein RadC
MEVYERETQEISKRFLERRLNFAECIAAPDAALADFMPRMTGDQIARVRVVMLENNEIVVKEMERRGTARPGEHF